MQSEVIEQATISKDIFGTSTRCFDCYFGVYNDLLARGDFHALQVEDPGPEDAKPLTHQDILIGVRILRTDPTLTLHQATEQLSLASNVIHSRRQLDYAIFVIVRVMMMLDCTSGESPAERWQPNQRFIDFVNQSFPRELGVSDGVIKAMSEVRSMKAWKLKTRSGVSFRGTDDLARHLLLDPDGPTVYLFHHTTFLKAQLEQLRDENLGTDEELSQYLKRGRLPPRLLAETLHSIQQILFHFDDQRSGRILEKLIRKRGFDEDCAQPEGYILFENGKSLPYVYWGKRIAQIHTFITNRPPKNKFQRWMKWQTSESNALVVALAALVISVVVGILSLGLSGFQAWVAWKAWKEPVSEDSDVTYLLQNLVDKLRQP